jgi:hypothetical protein
VAVSSFDTKRKKMLFAVRKAAKPVAVFLFEVAQFFGAIEVHQVAAEFAHVALERQIVDVEFGQHVIFRNLAFFFEAFIQEKNGLRLRGLHVFSPSRSLREMHLKSGYSVRDNSILKAKEKEGYQPLFFGSEKRKKSRAKLLKRNKKRIDKI